MRKALALFAGLAGLMFAPLVVLLTLVGVATTALACTDVATGGTLRPDAPIPARALPWITATHTACPALPEPWIAAIMAQESSFNPDTFSNDVNGGTWGLFQLNARIWQATYHHPWSADLNHNGVWDVKDPLIHARIAGEYLCHRLTGVRRIRAAHPDWASTRDLTELEALALAHMSGENTLAYYPRLGPLTAQYLQQLRTRVADWTNPVPTSAATVTTSIANASTRASALPVTAGCTVPLSGLTAQRALSWALSHVGDAYVAGAQGPHAWDCSTFTYNAYKAAGLNWPMQISYQQYLDRTHIQLIPLANAEPGDLLFFDTGEGISWFNPVTHVAIVIDPVAGTMIHDANPSVGVTISNYKTDPYYQAHPPVAAPDANGIPIPGGQPVVGRIVA